jgi:hypothetical protein
MDLCHLSIHVPLLTSIWHFSVDNQTLPFISQAIAMGSITEQQHHHGPATVIIGG